MMQRSRKAQIWVSAILYILVITVIMVLVLNAGVPIIKDLQDKTVFTRSKNTFLALNQHINENPEIRVSRTEETDVFDIYLGYRCAPLIKDLREKGFKSWMQTITNRQINF